MASALFAFAFFFLVVDLTIARAGLVLGFAAATLAALLVQAATLGLVRGARRRRGRVKRNEISPQQEGVRQGRPSVSGLPPGRSTRSDDDCPSFLLVGAALRQWPHICPSWGRCSRKVIISGPK